MSDNDKQNNNYIPHILISLFIFCFGLMAFVSYTDAVMFCSALCDRQGQDYSYSPTKCVCYTPSQNFKFNASKINENDETFLNVSQVHN